MTTINLKAVNVQPDNGYFGTLQGSGSINQSVSGGLGTLKVKQLDGLIIGAGRQSSALTNLNIKTAVNLWISNPSSAKAIYGDISDWDTSRVTNMRNLFKFKSNFDDDISGWNVSNVTDMSGMFKGASSFYQDISNWNVSKVKNMTGMFQNATSMGVTDPSSYFSGN